MKFARAIGVSLALATMLSACDRSDPPSDRLERAAEDLVAEVESTPTPASQPAGPWAPRNECNQLPGAVDFLASVQAAIDTRDADAFLALAADDVKLDFGGGSGKAELRQRLAADDGAFWEKLATMLELGCAADDTAGITIPWYFAQEIPIDPYAGVIVTGENVPIYEGPGSDTPVQAQVSWDAVIILPETGGNEFAPVRWKNPDGGAEVEGYIARDKLRSIIDYRLIASRRNERWRITALLAGD